MKRFSKIFFFVCCILLITFHACSTSSFFYHPSKDIVYRPDTNQCRYGEVNFRSSNGNNLNGWFIKPKSDTTKITATILLLHGNAGNIGVQFSSLAMLAQAGFQGLVFDYQGYGTSEGKPSQENVLDDAVSALDYIQKREDVKNTKLILFGQSLGGNLAVAVAAQKQKTIDALITEGAFSGHEEIAVYYAKDYFCPGFLARWLIPSKYEAIDVIDKVTIPKLIIHSTEDNVCPFYMGKDLFEKAKDPKQFWEIKGSHIAACQLYPDEFIKKFREMVSQK